MYFVLNLINTKSTLVNNQKVHIEDLCYRPVKGKGCYRPSNVVTYLRSSRFVENGHRRSPKR